MESQPQPTDGDAHVIFDRVTMAFGERNIFNRLSFRAPKGKITVLLGGSGMGKSTTLRLIGGLIQPTSGSLLVDGDEVVGIGSRQMERVRSRLGMMFQHGALLDSTTVFDNLALPLRERTNKAPELIAKEVRSALSSVALVGAEELLPNELSGGMIKRVALARAIVTRPVILMCDEPLSGLDPITSKRIELLLKKVNRDLGITMLVVSHDSASTMRMADHVVVLLPGGAVEGDPRELVNSPDPRVSNLLARDVDESAVSLDSEIETVVAMSPDDLESTWS